MRFRSMHFLSWIGAGALVVMACAEGADLNFPLGSGGSSEPGSGGASGTGGANNGGGGANTGGSGNNTGGSGTNTGGAGGSAGNGGRGGAGGSAGTGGSAGSTGSGGVVGTGGSSGAGGVVGTGGSIGTGGAAGGSACGTAIPFDAGSGQTLFFDSFEADAGTKAWIPISTSSSAPGMWSLVTADGGSRVFAQQQPATGTAVLMTVNGNAAWTDQVIEAKVLVTAWGGTTSSTFVGICGRYMSPQNYYCAALRGDGKFALRARINDSGTTLNSSAPTVAATGFAGTWFSLKLEIKGNTLNGYYNGATIPTATVIDTTVCSGGVALIVEGATVQFDDVKVSVP